jgi:hypothetical protein
MTEEERLKPGPESAKLQAFLDAEKAKGLVDFKFSVHPDADRSKMTVESLAREINNMLAAPSIPDPELF